MGMANIYDYMKWRGDITFNERPFNDVDNLILSEICYAEMDDIVPGPGEGTVTIKELSEGYTAHGYESHLVNNPKETLELAEVSARFCDVKVGSYINRIDHDKQVQFSAVTFHIPDGTIYVAFRGTDNTIVGWREDLNFSFMETEGQREAVAYLNNIAKENNSMIRVGGHSKGGNLAVFAAAFADEKTKERIVEVYSNDGPGFNEKISKDPRYLETLNKVKLIMPSFSVVGILLNNKSERTIIKSDATGPMQHNPLVWQVNTTDFATVDEQDPASIFMDETVSRWLSTMDDKERMALVNSIFDSVDASGANTLQDIKLGKQKAFFAIAKAVMKIDATRKKELAIILKKLGAAGMVVAKEDLKATFEEWKEKVTGN